ncbi:MAG: DNA polymerase III subunit alpha [Arenicellales bacterium]|nr:DNA polymerase III subunit alpha [Arenicellales bacterium]|tara:strand:- start:1333 stop:4875 length:3543 start_codon:yes stop_codon:yes gene_type:complete
MKSEQPARSSAPFVHLRVHSEYSLVDGIVRIRQLVDRVRSLQMPAVAVTDVMNIFGAVKFYQAACKRGIKPLLGIDLSLKGTNNSERSPRLLVLCRTDQGYRSLCQLLTRAYRDGWSGGKVALEKSWLRDSTAGLIALSSGLDGEIGQAMLADNYSAAQKLAVDYSKLFPDCFYLELSRTGHGNEEEYISQALTLASEVGLPVVATNQVQFLDEDEYENHEVRVCINQGRVLSDQRRSRQFRAKQYLRSTEEMQTLFADIPEALQNSFEISRRCNVTIEFGKSYLPEFPLPRGQKVDTVFAKKAQQGLKQRLSTNDHAETFEHYSERLDLELDVIRQMGFAGYFLIVADFISWAKESDIPVGPGRGSGAGSLVAWALGITELDPIRYGLLFERFLNPERVSLPDFDIDFCMEGRDKVIDYVANRYGRDNVAQIVTYGTMAARAVVRDVGRVMNHPYGYVDTLAKLIPFEVGMTLSKALRQEVQLRERYEQEEEVKELIDSAKALEGLSRNVGKHAGGVVIAPSPLTDFSPLYLEQDSTQALTQFDKDDLEAVGLVKFDFLGLRTLTVIHWTVQMVNQYFLRSDQTPLNIALLDMDDRETFDLLKACKTTALFQLESRGMRDLVQRMQPDCFEDLIALVALFRPGPLQSGMVDDFINRKHGREEIEYPHPELESILSQTYGVILYQEQVMLIAQVLAGYTLGAADLLRQAMGKKKPEEMSRQGEIFRDGAKERGIDERIAKHIFDLMEKFAGYGFNKSHSAAYALVSYQTAWLKSHYPAPFLAASLSADMENTDKVVVLVNECRNFSIEVVRPDVNRCFYRFFPVETEKILYGLGAIKGVGFSAIEAIEDARESGGAFADLFDFCRRVDSKRINRRVLEALIKSGAMDEMGSHRASLLETLPIAVDLADQQTRDQQAGQGSLFGEIEMESRVEVFKSIDVWSDFTRLHFEKESLGLYLTGHPMDTFRDELNPLTKGSLETLSAENNGIKWVAGEIQVVRIMNTRRGERMAVITLDDGRAQLDIRIFPELYSRQREQLVKDQLAVVCGEITVDEYSRGYQMQADHLFSIDFLRKHYSSALVIKLNPADCGTPFFQKLEGMVDKYRGKGSPILFQYLTEAGESATLQGGEDWSIVVTPESFQSIAHVVGEENINLHYAIEELRALAAESSQSKGRWRNRRQKT